MELNAQKRDIVGHRSLNVLRKQGWLPAIVFGRNFNSVPVQVNKKEFEKVYAGAGESSLVYLKIDSQTWPIIIQHVAKDPVIDQPIHADFYKVSLDKKITANVPLVYMGESPAVKNLGGILVKNINEVEVEALPQNLPHEIKVDLSALQTFGNHVLVKDVAVPLGVEIKNKLEEIAVLVQEPISQEELDKQLAVSETSVEEVEVTGREKEEVKETEEELPKEETKENL